LRVGRASPGKTRTCPHWPACRGSLNLPPPGLPGKAVSETGAGKDFEGGCRPLGAWGRFIVPRGPGAGRKLAQIRDRPGENGGRGVSCCICHLRGAPRRTASPRTGRGKKQQKLIGPDGGKPPYRGEVPLRGRPRRRGPKGPPRDIPWCGPPPEGPLVEAARPASRSRATGDA